MIRVLIADDHPIVRSGIRTELARRGGFEILGEALNGDQALALALELRPDVLLLDVNMPGLKAVQVLRQLKRLPDSCRVLVLTAYSDAGTVYGMLKAGADGYLLKDEDPAVIPDAVEALMAGRRWLSQAAASKIATLSENGQAITGDSLTRREQEVLHLLAEGSTNKEIAQQTDTTERTVEFHVSNILIKLGVKSRLEAVLWAREHGIV